MPTRRTPLHRALRRKITPEAIAAFRRMEALASKCTCPPRDWGGEYWARQRCAACEERQREHSVLHHALGLKPWEWPAYEHPDLGNPWPEGSYMWQRHKPDERGVALYRELEEASRAD
jgi:hypothetical protein